MIRPELAVAGFVVDAEGGGRGVVGVVAGEVVGEAEGVLEEVRVAGSADARTPLRPPLL